MKKQTKKQEDERIIAYIEWCKTPNITAPPPFEGGLTTKQKLVAIDWYITDLQEDVLKLTDKLQKARSTNFFLFIIGMLFGCGGTLIGIGIGLWTGVI